MRPPDLRPGLKPLPLRRCATVLLKPIGVDAGSGVGSGSSLQLSTKMQPLSWDLYNVRPVQHPSLTPPTAVDLYVTQLGSFLPVISG